MKTLSYAGWTKDNWTMDFEVTFPHEFRMDIVVNDLSFAW